VPSQNGSPFQDTMVNLIIAVSCRADPHGVDHAIPAAGLAGVSPRR
jgi:hypothetical protein